MPAIGAAPWRQRLPGWQLRFRQVSWGDPAVGPARTGTVDVAVAWLPDGGGPGIAHQGRRDRAAVGGAARRSTRLAPARAVPFAELADEAFVALPASAGRVARGSGWPPINPQRSGAGGAEAATRTRRSRQSLRPGGSPCAPAGNAPIYRRDHVACRCRVPEPAAVPTGGMWRAADRAVRFGRPPRTRCRCMARISRPTQKWRRPVRPEARCRGVVEHGTRSGHGENRLLPVQRGVRPRASCCRRRAVPRRRASRPCGSPTTSTLDRRAGPVPVRVVGHRRVGPGHRRCPSPPASPARCCASTRRSSPRRRRPARCC